MNPLLGKILDAHGGMDRWNGFERIDASIVSGEGFFPLKGILQDSAPRRTTVWLHEERTSILPYGAPDQRAMFTPERVVIEKLGGTPIAEPRAPKDSFAVGMALGTGVKSALNASVFSAAAGAFGLALLGPDPWSVDGLRAMSDRSDGAP